MSMLDWREQTQTSPTKTFLYSSVLLPLIVIGNGPPASPASNLTSHLPLSSAVALASFSRKVTVIFSPLSAVPQTLTFVFCCSTIPSVQMALGLTSAQATALTAAHRTATSNTRPAIPFSYDNGLRIGAREARARIDESRSPKLAAKLRQTATPATLSWPGRAEYGRRCRNLQGLKGKKRLHRQGRSCSNRSLR